VWEVGTQEEFPCDHNNTHISCDRNCCDQLFLDRLGHVDAAITPDRPTRSRPNGEPRWLDQTEMTAWRAFIETTHDLVAALDDDLQQNFGITLGDYEVLVFLSEAPDRQMRMCDLAARLHLSPSGLTRRLDGLVRDGLVARVPSQADRRVLHAALTDAGYAHLEQAAPTHVESVRARLLDPLTADQVSQLGAVFLAVRAALDASADDL
jgi:DNA-binding MarR family transcriptional regulator